MNYTIKEKTNLLSELIAMAYADARLTTAEIKLITTLGARLHIENDEIQELIANHTVPVINVAKNEMKRMINFHRLILMMVIDSKITESELQLLFEIALKYGISRDAVIAHLELIRSHPSGAVPVEKLLEAHERYKN